MINAERLAQITHLDPGAHAAEAREWCVMEAAAYVGGEPHSDHPACVCPVLGAFLRSLNDGLFREHLDLLVPYVPRVVGTKSTPAVERQRAYLLADWVVREIAPVALDAAALAEHATRLRPLPPVLDAPTAEAEAAWAAAEAAAEAAAAWEAAWAAAARSAVEKQDEIRASSLALLDRLLAVNEEEAVR